MSKILPEGQRTLDAYKKFGVQIRLCDALLRNLANSGLLPAADRNRLDQAMRTLAWVRSDAESAMYKDHPDIGPEYSRVFYGPFMANDPGRRHAIDDELLETAKAVMEEILDDANQK